MLYLLVIVGWFCQSGLISVISGSFGHLGCLRHNETTLLFWGEFLILGRICHSGMNLSFCKELSFWVDTVIRG